MVIAKKKYGQNFLVDHNVINQIISEIKFDASKTFLEIGPGKGALTKELIKKINPLTIIEIDVDMINILKQINTKNLEIIQIDVLKLDEQFFNKFNIVIGNLPYYISSEIIFKLLPISQIINMYFMLQREVADRLIAKAGTKDNSILTNLVNFYFDTEKLIDVNPNAFEPAPKVKSSFIKLTRHNKYNERDYEPYKNIVRTSFKFKRKNLKNNLKNILSEKDFDFLQLDPTSRAEDLSVEDFLKIANCVFNNDKKNSY
jgi:16S rRNA (adenine1518-N6/adenine1519-N6)-dimethyltransferase